MGIRERMSLVVAPWLWDALPREASCLFTCLDSFGRLIKMMLFQWAFNLSP